MYVPSNLVVAVVFLVYFKNVTSRPFDGDVPAASTTPMSKEMANKVLMISNKSWDLNLCEPGIRLEMGKKTLNKKSFFCNKKNAMKLAPMLFGEGLEDRVYVWCRMAALYSSVGNSSFSTPKSFVVDNLMYFEGDMVLTRESVDEILAPYFPTPELQRASLSAARDYQEQFSPQRQKRKIVAKNSQMLWPNGIVQYHIDDAFSSTTRETILEAISEYQLSTCIRFVPVSAKVNHSVIKFQNTLSGCSSNVGMMSNKENVISIGNGCEYFGIITHEIGHALGFYHEQARPDRDHYVTVLNKNVKIIYRGNFLKKSSFRVASHGVPYDYSSVMHYGSHDFGEGKMTIRTNDPAMEQVIGQRVSLSFLDVKMLNIAYCSMQKARDSSKVCGTRDLEWTQCQNGGYRNPNNCVSCVCPDGFAPPLCKEPSVGLNTAYTTFGGKSRQNNDRVDVDCGSQTLLATKDEQVLTSPGFDNDGFGDNAYCPWLIKASTKGKRVHLKFVERFHFYKDSRLTVCEHRVEVKYKDLLLPGPRHCGHDTPKLTYRSHGPELLVTGQTLNYTTDWQGFQAIYTEENCGGCSDDSTNREPVCFRTVKYDCPIESCFFCKLRSVQNTATPCYRDEGYCCDGFYKVDDLCIREGYSPLGATSNINPPTSTAELTTSTPGPTTTTPEPTTSNPEPTTTTFGPTTSTPEPTTTTTKQTTPTPKPSTLTAKVTASTTKPTTPTTEPTTPSTKPTTSPPKPTIPKLPTTRPSVHFRLTNLWFRWSDWSACSATCGLCGVRTRRRSCFRGPCSGPSEEKEICGTPVCMEETIVDTYKCKKTKKNCDERLSNNKCKVDSTCDVKKMIPMCCRGEANNKQCTIFFAARRGD